MHDLTLHPSGGPAIVFRLGPDGVCCGVLAPTGLLSEVDLATLQLWLFEAAREVLTRETDG